MSHLRTPLSLAALAALTVVAPLAGCSGPGAAEAGTVAAADVFAGDEGMPNRVVPTTARSTTTTTPPTTTTTTTTAPPPTTVVTAPPPPAPAPARVAATAPPSPAAPSPPSAPSSNDEARVLQLINGERAKAGVGALQVSGGARSVAQEWSGHMAGHGLAHNPDLSGDLARAGVTGWTSIGENVGYGSSVDQVHQAFMGSGGHRANIVKASFSHVGIGVVQSGGTVWVTLDFVGY